MSKQLHIYKTPIFTTIFIFRRREQQEAIHEARPRQRSERRPDRIDQDERRRRREHERRTTDSRLSRNDRDLRDADHHRSQRRHDTTNTTTSTTTTNRKESDRGDRRRKSSPKPLRIKKVIFDINLQGVQTRFVYFNIDNVRSVMTLETN